MKKLSAREKIMVGVLIGGLLLFALYKILYTPLQEQKTALSQEIETLVVQTKNLEALQGQLTQIKSQSSELQSEIDKMDVEKGFGVMNYQELLTFLGEAANEYDVDIIQFKRLDYEDKVNYWEVPFEVSLQGDYRDIILFVDSIYQLDDYFAIRQLNLKQIDMIPMTDKVSKGELPEENKGVGFDWSPDFINRLNEMIPSDILSSEAGGTEGETKPSEGSADYQSYLNQIKGNYQVEEKVELMFSFHFISLEETPEDLKKTE